MSFRAALLAAFLPLFTGTSLAVPNAAPADARLNDRGRTILAYFQQLQASPDLKVISGQFCSFGLNARLEAPEKIFQTTGRWPALISVDYADFKNKGLETHLPNALLLDYWRAGGLVSVSAHFNNPAFAEGGGLKEKGPDLAQLLVSGSPENQRWLKQLDVAAAGLLELQAAGVVVLWRPFHEMNGGWFWWGAQKPAALIQAWQQMFDYFTHTKGLHNLIWVYGPNKGEHLADYYPGDGFADLIGIDAYTDNVDATHIKGYADLAAINKPFGFTEFGPHGAANPPGDFDYRRFLSGVEKDFPRTRFFLSWDEKWNPGENRFAREFYTDPRVITRTELPPGLAGDEPPDTLENWRAGRLTRLTKPDGWLSLIGRHLLQPGKNSLGTAAGNSVKLAAGPPFLGTITLAENKLIFDPAPGAIAQVNGQPAQSGELSYQEENPTEVSFGTVSFFVMQRGDRFYLRVKDSASSHLKEFSGLDYFPADPTWRIEADWVPYNPPQQIKITNVLGQISTMPVPGKATFTREGKTFQLLPVDEGEGELFFIFTDLTAGSETYEAARFFYADKPTNGKIILDFNRAYNPPCAFTPFATCPLPPKENALPLRVTAGEKKYRRPHE